MQHFTIIGGRTFIRIRQVLRTLASFFTDAVVEMQCALLEFLVTIAQKPHVR